MANVFVFFHTGHDITSMVLTQALKPLGCSGEPLAGKHPVFDLEFNPLVCCMHTRIDMVLIDILICINMLCISFQNILPG